MLIGNRFQLNNKINSGSFGQIHLATDIKTKQTVAVKMEPINCKHPQLQYEAKLLAYLIDDIDPRQNGLPRLHYYGKYDKYHVMIMDLLGPSLEELFQKCNKKFDIKTVVMVGIQIFQRLEFMHRKKFIHRDIKPENFLLGMYKHCDKVFMIDLGLSKKYITKTGQHIPYRDDRSLKGTPRYTSLNSHLGIQQSRRDDLQSVVYMLIYFLKGQLPWQNLKQDANYDRYQKILQKKLSVSVENLCSGIPRQFAQLVQYTRNLHFIQEPNYQKIKDLLRQALMQNTGEEYNPKDLYCWQKTQNQLQSQVVQNKKSSQKSIPINKNTKQSQVLFAPVVTFQQPQAMPKQKSQQQQNFFFPSHSKNQSKHPQQQRQFSPFDSDFNQFGGNKKSSLMESSKKKDDSIDFNVFRKNRHSHQGNQSSEDQGEFKAFEKNRRDSLDDDNPFGATKTQQSQDEDNPFGNFGGNQRQVKKQRWAQNSKKNQSLDDPFGDFKQPQIEQL